MHTLSRVGFSIGRGISPALLLQGKTSGAAFERRGQARAQEPPARRDRRSSGRRNGSIGRLARMNVHRTLRGRGAMSLPENRVYPAFGSRDGLVMAFHAVIEKVAPAKQGALPS